MKHKRESSYLTWRVALLIFFVTLVFFQASTPHTVSGQSPTRTPTRTPTAVPAEVEAIVNANIRSGPGSGYARLGNLARGDRLPVLGIDEDELWYAVRYDGRQAWITADKTVTRLIPESARNTLALIATPTRTAPRPTSTGSGAAAATQAPSSGVTCPSLSYTCAQLTCAQAYACLAAGNTKLDRDRDGIPCESKCR
ncbi:hypothetical protein FBQ95_17285 [Chloroflexi bacterium CFX3]|nr:hypothetical protein [Chloroflexi bacterium CFX3]